MLKLHWFSERGKNYPRNELGDIARGSLERALLLAEIQPPVRLCTARTGNPGNRAGVRTQPLTARLKSGQKSPSWDNVRGRGMSWVAA